MIAAAVAAPLFFQHCKNREPEHFQRFHFRAGEKTAELFFDKTAHRWAGRAKQKIPPVNGLPRGAGILFENKGVLFLKPGIKGEKGIFFHVFARGYKKQNVSVSISIKREKTVIHRESCGSDKKGRLHYTFAATHEFAKGDTVVVEAAGNGVLVVSDPLLYDRVEKKKKNTSLLLPWIL